MPSKEGERDWEWEDSSFQKTKAFKLGIQKLGCAYTMTICTN